MIFLTMGDWLAVVDRIASLERELKKAREESQEQFDNMAAKIPTITKDGKLEATVFGQGDDYETVYLQFTREDAA